MYIKNIEISNFRNIKKMNLEFNKSVNIFIGKNAQGKTSILESIYVLAFTKSCKGFNEEELIKNGERFFRVKGLVKKGSLNRKFEVSYKKNDKIIKIDEVKINKISNYISNINVIMFSPDDLDIVKKSPSVRRNFLNIELCQLHSDYLKALNEYNKILKMRNEYIRKNNNSINYTYLDVITKELIDREIIICKYRNEFINEINEKIDNIFYKITRKKGLKLKYKRNIEESDKLELFKVYKKNYPLDFDKGTTNNGSHRDDFEFYFNDSDLKLYGSQGLQRLAILSLKLAEIDIFKNKSGNYPIVLLDDIFSEIDLDKRKNLLKFIKKSIQFIITTTDINNISEKILTDSTVFEVENGIIKKRSDKIEGKTI